MQMYWIYNVPTWVFALLVLGGIVGISLVGLVVTRPMARRFFGEGEGAGKNELVGDVMQSASALYGITLGLIAVGAWSASGDADAKVGNEATQLAALYRDVSCLPESVSGELHVLLRKYTRYVIDEAWPQQREGKVPEGATAIMTEFIMGLKKFKPADAAEQVFMAEAFTQFNRFYEARRQRLQTVDNGMPAVLWYVVFAGASINIGLMWCFVIERLRVHALFVALVSCLIGLLIFITAAMDNPFRGAFGLSPEPYEMSYRQLMQK
jgi:hypothetical protein